MRPHLNRWPTPNMMDDPQKEVYYHHPRRRRTLSKALPPSIVAYLRRLVGDRREAVSRTSRLIVILICGSALTFYLVQFFRMYCEYPTVVDVSVNFPDEPELPGITVCNHNRVKKRFLCQWNKTLCEGTNIEFFDVRDYLAQINATAISAVSPNREETFAYCEINNKLESRDVTADLCWKAPFLYFETLKCNVINGQFDGYHPYPMHGNETAFRMILDLQPEDYVMPEIAGAEIYVHSPYQLPDARSSHFSAYAGKIYNIGISKTTAQLMEAPYRTNCQNYTTLVLNGKLKDYISESTCMEDCLKKVAIKNCSCIPNCLTIWNDTDKCTGDRLFHKNCCVVVNAERENCHKHCPVACDFRVYDLSWNDEVLPKLSLVEKNVKLGKDYLKQFTHITIMLTMVRDTKYQHNAKITEIEILGYVGGYVGIFLGMSIPLMYSYILQLVEYTLTVFKRKSLIRGQQPRAFRIQV